MSKKIEGESDGSTPKMWQCIHPECGEDLPPTRKGKAPPYCMFCGRIQVRCINPDCQEPLFSEKAEVCHKCRRSQQIDETSSASVSLVAANPDGGDLKNANSKTDDTTDEKNITKTMSAESTPPGESSTDVEDLKKPIQESQAPQSTPHTGSNTSGGKPPGDSSIPPAPEKDPDTQVVNQTVNQTPPATCSSADQTSDKKPPSIVVSEADPSSDHELFHTPPPTPNANEADLPEAACQQQPPKAKSSISDSLKRMSLDSANRKHSLDREESDESDESNPAKRKALDSGDPSAADTGEADGATDDQIGDEHKKVKQQKAGKADQQKEDQNDEDEGEEDHPLKEVP
jgi:hypothetical protein